MKKISIFLLCFLVAVTCLQIGSQGEVIANSTIKVDIDGKEVRFTDAFPYIDQHRVMVPVRAITEAMGAEVAWNNQLKQASFKKGNNELKLGLATHYVQRIKSGQAQILKIDKPTQLIGERIYVPLRVIGESFNYEVTWNESQQRVSFKANSQTYETFTSYPLIGEIIHLNTTELDVFWLSNQQRVRNGLQPFGLHVPLSLVARDKSIDMQRNNYFDHHSPVFGSPFDMIRQYQISFRSAGENIAAGYTSPVRVVEGWMNSEGHRANILGSFQYLGVGYHHSSTGTYRHYWTQMFLTP